MAQLLPFWIFPALFLVGCLALILWNPRTIGRRPGLYGLGTYLVSFALGTVSLLESRGSTSGLGFLFLPGLAMAPGLMASILGALQQWRQRLEPSSLWRRIQGIGMALSTLGILAVLGFQAIDWYDTRRANHARDQEPERHREAIRANTQRIEGLLAAHPGEEAALIEREASGSNDRTLLIPLARSPYAPTSLLDRLARSPDLGVALSAVRNPNISQDTLVWVYRDHIYPAYFYSTLAGHPRSPSWMLAELYEKRDQNAGVAPALSRNPNTPEGILGLIRRAKPPDL